MQLVRQKEKRTVKRRTSGTFVLVALLGAALAAGCGQSPSGTDQHGRRGSAGAGGRAAAAAAPQAGPVGALVPYAEQLKRRQAQRVAVAKRWGLAEVPLPAPAPPAVKPEITSREGFEVDDGEDLPQVFTTVPTDQRIVFLTIDDGAEKDPEFIRMMDELKIPYTAFLSDYLASEDYGYFAEMQKKGVTLNNHTLTHPYLPGLSYAEQKKEICDQQDRIEKHFGKRPVLLRPPYGNYNRDTLVVAKSCGIKAVPLWAEEAFPDHMDWREWDRDLHPGDIVLTHFQGPGQWKGTMADMVRNVMKVITEKGYAVARLDDYV
ncbi:polysaccharide deacetylase family protein [Streptomyces sp. NPDC008125]|uniref:polysaccharide deacetylase family protein n=1 Tax=Streptomyces sp. NPDC008125 TaxID=3364811 RepID=UPI0036EAA6FD